jgi:hypothetical protein
MIDNLQNIQLGSLNKELESPFSDQEKYIEKTPEKLEILETQLSNLHENLQSDFDINRKKLSSKLSPIAYTVSSAYHVLSGLGMAVGLLKSDSLFVKNATRLTKLINSLVYGDLAIDAWKGKQSFDFISKVLEPTLNCFSQLSNYHLLRGLGSAMTQLHLVNFPHVNSYKTMWENFIANLQETKRFFVESWTSPLLGPNRRLGRGRKDEGHTMALLSHIQGLSGILGLLNGSRRNLIDKIVGTTRNVIGIGVDLDLLFKKDPDEKKTGQYYFAHAIFDTLKRFVSKEKADVIDNLAMPLYNKAMYHFGKITRNQSEGTYVKTVNPLHEKKHDIHVSPNEYSVTV